MIDVTLESGLLVAEMVDTSLVAAPKTHALTTNSSGLAVVRHPSRLPALERLRATAWLTVSGVPGGALAIEPAWWRSNSAARTRSHVAFDENTREALPADATRAAID